jgi:ComF family protein
VRGLKFRRNTAAGVFMAERMARHLATTDPPALSEHVLVPIPVHRVRRRKRGFDQGVWLAERLSERLGLPVYPRALRRVRPTLPQGDPRTVSRRRNVEGAFEVRRWAPPPGRRILLVDDVTTSGETAAECSRVLARAGARSVSLVTACRARDPGRDRKQAL